MDGSIYTLSDYSQSYPISESAIDKRSVSTFSKNISEFRNALLRTSIDKMIEIKVDISKFYSTISIPKSTSKQKNRGISITRHLYLDLNLYS